MSGQSAGLKRRCGYGLMIVMQRLAVFNRILWNFRHICVRIIRECDIGNGDVTQEICMRFLRTSEFMAADL